MDTFALWIGYAMIFAGSVLIACGLIFAAIYYATYFINCSQRRIADSIAGNKWLGWIIEEAKRREAKP